MSTRLVAAITCQEDARPSVARRERGERGGRCGVGVGWVGGGLRGWRAHLDVVVLCEAVELVEQLEHRPLHLAISGELGVETLGAHLVRVEIGLRGQLPLIRAVG